MALLSSEHAEFGKAASDFQLKNVDGSSLSLEEIRGNKGTLLMFICNHCPYVLRIIDTIVRDMKTLQDNGIGVAAIMSNDTITYPEDSFENMQDFAKEHGFTFPYLYDETQEAAKSYGAVCTPDFFGYNAQLELQYRGRLVNPEHRDHHELVEAMLDIAKNGQTSHEQFPSMGCSIKWAA